MSDTHSLRQNVINLLTARAGEWVNGHELAKVGGTFAFRTRISEARRLHAMAIENRCRRMRLDNGQRFTITEYRFVPPSQPVQASLLDAHV
jgi:hypothetical protein